MQVQSPLNYPDCIQVPTMNDYPFKSQIEAIWGKSTGNDFSIAVTEVQKRWEWNNKSCLLTFSCPRRDAYEAVISTYYNLAKDKKIAEYRDKSTDANKVILEVSKVSGKGETFVKEVLNYLYWGSIDDTQDVSQAISLPISSQTKSEYREIPEEYKQTFGQTVTDSLGGLATTLKWAGVIAAVGIGAYALTQVNTTAKLLGRKTNGLSDKKKSLKISKAVWDKYTDKEQKYLQNAFYVLDMNISDAKSIISAVKKQKDFKDFYLNIHGPKHKHYARYGYVDNDGKVKYYTGNDTKRFLIADV